MAGPRVLFVEDETLIRLLIVEVLRDEGFDVVDAKNGDDAASVLDQAGSFDLLFTDVQMPGKLDGVDVAVYARRRDPTIPVLVVSGLLPEKVTGRLKGLEPSATFIGKPYNLDEIVETVRLLARER